MRVLVVGLVLTASATCVLGAEDPHGPRDEVLDAEIAPELAPLTHANTRAEMLPTDSTVYVAVGVVTGFAPIGLGGAGTLEGGYKLSAALWLHGMGSLGSVPYGDSAGERAGMYQIRGGIEAHHCSGMGFACFTLGSDVGYLHEDGHGSDAPNHDYLVLVPRVGADLGGTNFRLRPGVEAYLAPNDGLIGINMTLAVAYQW